MTIGEKIKSLRNERSMTQTELAGDQITRNMLSLIESGNAQPSLSTILYIAQKLGVPAGYLLADEEGEYIYKKNMSIARIRKALLNREYSLCRELCENIIYSEQDDEILMILAECALGIAKELFFEGKLKSACREFERACEYSEKTVYSDGRICAEATVYCTYMYKVSQTLFAECDADTSLLPMSVSDSFCRYALIVEGLERGELSYAEEYAEREDFLSRHIHAKISMKNGDFRSAHEELMQILNGDENMCGAVMYDAFRELEQCCREIGDFKGAYEYSGAKVMMLERLLADG